MKHFFFSMVILAAAPTVLHAQYSSPAFDPNCYFPSVNDPSEMQVIYGESSNLNLGWGLVNIGPAPGESQGRIMFAGLPQNPPFLTAIRTGPSFDLNNPDIQGTMNMPVQPTGKNQFGSWNYSFYELGHFHTKDRLDMLMRETGSGDAWRIYWADENGLYDSTRYGDINTSFWFQGIASYLESEPYCAYLTSDTVEDIIFGGDGPADTATDSTFSFRVYLFQGGESLFQKGDSISEDSSDIIWQDTSTRTYVIGFDDWNAWQGDYRGVGREDLIAGEANLFYYRNDPPFSLENFANVFKYDTLVASWQSSTFFQPISSIAIPALSASNDDFLFDYEGNDGSDDIHIYKGGSNFGKKRIFIDSPDFVIHDPSVYDPAFGGGHYITEPGNRTGSLTDCGDMTGTGRHVLRWENEDGSDDAFQFFYVLGPGMDDKADMFVAGYKYYSFLDTISVNAVGFEDIALGIPNVDDTNGQIFPNAGQVEIIYGSKKIPVPASSVALATATIPQALIVFPNPIANSTTVTWQPSERGAFTVRLMDILGRIVFETQQFSTGAYESFKLTCPRLPSGEYVLELEQGETIQRTKVVIQ